MDLLFRPMALCVDHPWAVFVVAAGLVCMFFGSIVQQRRGASVNPWPLLLAASVWGVYGVYEHAMFAWSKTVTAPIRVDLFLIAPVLYVVTIGALTAWAMSGRGTSAPSHRPAGLLIMAWLVVLWSGVSLLWNILEFHVHMDIYRFTPAGELYTWLRSAAITASAVLLSVSYLLAGMRVLRRVRGAATVMRVLAILSLVWTLVGVLLGRAGLPLLLLWVRTSMYLAIPVAWYMVLFWYFARPSVRAYCSQSG